jgi:AcrR family transcriptional regulator
MTTDNKEIWIKTGYETFALCGQNGLKIEPLAKKVGISKSSFYHHFADLKCFLENLFNYHLQMCLILAEKERNCKSLHSELINVLIEHRVDLLFNRQLRINKNDKRIKETLIKSDKLLGNYAIMLWAKEINVKLTRTQLEGIFEMATDDFYMQINEDNLNFEHLSNYFINLSNITKKFV